MDKINKNLNEVNGGDYGDCAIEDKLGHPLYNPGDKVEVYAAPKHRETVKATIIKSVKDTSFWYDCFKYLVEFEDRTRQWKDVSEIKRGSNCTLVNQIGKRL